MEIEVEMYLQLKENEVNVSSGWTRVTSVQDRTQLYSRISSSKTYATEVTEKSSLLESSMGLSRPATSFVFSPSLSPKEKVFLFFH